MSECLFCRIVAGEIPSERILNTDTAYAFMDIGPLAEGHVLLIPRNHYKTLAEMPQDEAGQLLKHLPALAGAVQQATACQGLNILQNNGRVAHQVVPHVHFHLIPRNEGDAFSFNWPAGEYAEGRMEKLADAIRSSLT